MSASKQYNSFIPYLWYKSNLCANIYMAIHSGYDSVAEPQIR